MRTDLLYLSLSFFLNSHFLVWVSSDTSRFVGFLLVPLLTFVLVIKSGWITYLSPLHTKDGAHVSPLDFLVVRICVPIHLLRPLLCWTFVYPGLYLSCSSIVIANIFYACVFQLQLISSASSRIRTALMDG